MSNILWREFMKMEDQRDALAALLREVNMPPCVDDPINWAGVPPDWFKRRDLALAGTASQPSPVQKGGGCACGKKAWHWVSGTDMCCECYVKAGNPPADWHPDCMRATDNQGPSKP